MAVMELNALSVQLSGSFSATVIMPENEALHQDRCGALYLLHDVGEDDTYFRTIKNLEALASRHGLFIIAPSLMHSFGLDLPYGGKYGRFIWEELPGICRHMFPLDPERVFIGGVGWGSYGAAVQAAAHPEVFKKCFGINGRFDIAGLCEAALAGEGLSHLRLSMLEALFAPLEKVRGSNRDLLGSDGTVPKELYIGCPEDSPYLEENAALAQAKGTALHTAPNEEKLFEAALAWL